MLWGMGTTIGLQVVLQHLQLVGTRSLEKRLTRRFSIGFEHQILALPERFYSQRNASDIAGRMEINASIAEFIGGQLIPMGTGLVLLVFSGDVPVGRVPAWGRPTGVLLVVLSAWLIVSWTPTFVDDVMLWSRFVVVLLAATASISAVLFVLHEAWFNAGDGEFGEFIANAEHV